jgi:MtfA peptidase
MPGDSSYYIIKDGQTYRIADSLMHGIALQQGQHTEETVPEQKENNDHSASTGALFTISIFIIIFGGRALWNSLRKKYRIKLANGAYASNFDWYHQELSTYNQYYKSLSSRNQEKFVQRTVSFMFNKKFTYVNIAAEDYMPLLISAAAVQITFGLNKYHLDYFKDIFIYKEDYQYGTYNLPFMGHVNADGIHLSWNNFLKGYQNYTDADNVGIHEMAHALAYVNFQAGNGGDVDNDFKERFHHFSAIARPIFNSMQQGDTNLLSNYATTNYHEFWAVAVETFFEKSMQMKSEMPVLYYAMCSLLNQDPLTADKIVKRA